MRFLDDYDPRKEQKKKQQKNGALSAPRSGNSLFPFAQNSKNKTNTPSATPRTTKGTALGGSSVTPVQLPQRQLTVPKLTKATVSTRKTTATRVPQQLKIPEIKAFGASMPTARKTAATTRRTVDTATIPEIRAFGTGMPTARKTETTARRAVDTAKMPEIKAFGAGDYSAGAKSLEDFFTRVGKTIVGGSKGALASNMDAMGAAYEAGQGQRTSMYEAELREAQWAVARAKRDYDLDPSQMTKTELDAALTKMKAFATVLGDGAYQQALTAAYDAAVKIGTVETTKELTALYNSLGKVNVDASTGVQQQATEAARDMALDVQVSGGKDIASAKEGLGQFGQMVVDAGASGTQMAIDILLNKVMETPGSKLPLAFRAFGGATQQARADGADITGQVLYGGAVAAKEVATEMIFNIALPFTKAYGGGALDDVVQNGIQKAVNKLGKTDAGKRALNALLQIGASGMSEGLEEFIGDWMEWQMPRLYGGEVSSAEETLANSLYDYVVGGLSGMGGAVISPGTYRLEMPTLTDAQGRTYEQRQAAEYRGEMPQNVSDPRIGTLELSSEKYNPTGADISTVYGNRYRQQVKEDAIRRLGIAEGKPAYLVASNITKNGQEYYVDVTKASLNKMLFTREHEILPIERILLVDNLEKVIDNSYWAESNGDRKSRPQIDGFDTLRTSFYVDGIPYYADIKVKVVQGKNGADSQNVVYFLEPEEITTIKKVDVPSPTGALLERNIVFRDGTSTVETSVPQSGTAVNTQGMQNGGEYAAASAAPLQVPRLTTYEERQAAEASGQRTATRYTAEEAAAKRKDARTFRNIIAGIDTSISDFFDRWKSGRKSHLGEKLEQLYIAPMPNNMAEDISKIVGYNVNGRDFIVTSDDVKHVMDQHGNSDAEIAKGNIPLETWMLDALPDVVTNPDSIEPGNLGTGNKNAGKRGIVFSKAFPGGKIITIQFDNKGRGTLELNTLYAKESAILEGNGTNAPNTFTPEAAKSALSYAEKTRMSRYTMPNTTESAVPVINVQSGPPQSFFSETSVPQGGTGVNTQGMQDGGEYAAAPAAPLQVPRLTTYEERQAEQRAERVANLVDNIDALHEAVDNGLRSPQLTTYEERARAKAEAEKASVRDRVRQMDAMTDAAAERAVEQRVQQEQQGREMPEALKKLGVAPFGSEADYAGIDNLAQEMQWNGSARKQTQRQMNKIPATEKERSFARKLADGTLDAADIPNTVNRETVETLADFYRTLDSAPETMLLRQRRATIMEREEAKMEPLLGMDVAYDEGGLRTNGKGDRKNSGRIAKTTSTLRRNLQTPARICATEWGTEHGKKVYETLFYPVTENNGRQIDWVNSMLDRVRTFKDSKGEERPLNRKERELVQKIVEYRASEKRVAAFDEQYTGAVENVRNGASAADAAKEFGIDPSYQEYQDLQNYQTYLRTLEELHDSKSADSTAVDSAVEAYSGLYRELYDGINSFLVAHGYQPIGFIEGYAPHMQPEAEKTAFSKALKLLGLDDTAMSLPTSISGKTADLKPYKQYNPFFQERHGVNTEYDIAKGFEEYIYYLSNIFYHTDDIMRIRTAEKYIRKTYSSEEASELINQAEGARDFSNDQIADFLRVSGVVQKGTELAPGDARVFLEDYIGKLYDQIGNVTRYSEMAKYLDNYANRLAGKQNMADRGAEAATGRGSLNWINTLTGKYGGAKLAFNVSSALNQTSQIPMVAAENGERATLHAIGDFFKSKKDRADFVQESNFLKGKKGIDWLLEAETPWEQVKEWSFSPIEAVDSFTSYVAVRSKYLKEIRAGKSHEDAMKLADEFGRHVMGSRARGEKPMLFDTKNPFWQIVTRFQLEALNSWEHISRDLPNEARQMALEKGKAYAAGTMGVRVAKYMTYAFLLNLGIGALSGGSPVPYDVVGSVMEALGKSMGVSKLAMVEDVIQKLLDGRLFKKDDDDEDDADKDWWAFLGSLWGDIANDVPVVGQVAALLGVGDQTLPTTDLSKVKDFAESVKNNGLLSMDTLDKGLTAAGEFVYAGNQARKTLQGGIAVGQGGVYSKGKLRYQVDQTPWNVAKGLLFGRSALDESQAYYAERTSDFTEKQTDTFQQMQDVGVSAKASYDLIRELKEAEETEQFTEAEWQREILRQSQVNDSGKWVAYYQTMASDKEIEAMDAVEYHSEADYGTVTNLLMDMKDLETDAEKMRLIDSSDLTEQQKASLYKNLVAGKEDLKKIYALLDADISDYQYFQYKLTTSGLTKKEAKLNAINTLDLPDSQKDALYYLNSYASSTHGEAPWVQGMTAEQSTVRLAEILAEEEDDEDNTPKWQQSLNSYLGKGNTNSEVSQMLANVRRLNGGTAGGYSSGGGLTVSAMLANVRRLNGRTVGGYSSGSNLTVSEMLANVRRLNR